MDRVLNEIDDTRGASSLSLVTRKGFLVVVVAQKDRTTYLLCFPIVLDAICR